MALQHRSIFWSGQRIAHFYLCQYKPKHTLTQDKLSTSLLRFKYRNPIDVAAWTECSSEELAKIFMNSRLALLRALGHNQLKANPTDPLSSLCNVLARTLKSTDSSACLYKLQAHQKMSTLNKRERYNEMKNKYLLDDKKLTSKRILILDDIYTTGATVMAIISVIKRAVPDALISVFTFAVSEPAPELNDSIELKGHQYQWVAQQGWAAMEEEQEYSKEGLKKMISDDEWE